MSLIATRRERVVLDLEDNFSAGMIRAAAATELLNQRVNSLSKGAVESRRANRDMGAGFEDTARSAQRAESSIDKFSGRVGLLADVALTLGPALAPIGAVAVPAVAGLASQLGFAALAGGVAIGAFQGVGNALKTMNKAHLEPTTANLDKAALAMDQISPSAQHFVRQLQSMGPELKALRDTAGEGMFPGLEKGLESMEQVLPKVQRIIAAVSGELGSIGADAGASLAGPEWSDFFTFLETEAPHALSDLAHAVGNVAHAAAEMWMAFTPLNNDFSGWMVDATADLDKWATGLDQTQGFQEFIAYVEKSGPQVGAALGAIGNALLQIVEAAAPIGGPVLAAITALSNGIAKIADSDLGTPIMAGVIALRLYSRALSGVGALTNTAYGARAKANVVGFGNSLLQVTSAQERASKSVLAANIAQRDRMTTLAKGAGTLALLGVTASGTADKVGLTNTAILALAGSMVGPWGAAAGAGAGLFLDMQSASSGFADGLDKVNAALDKNNLAVAKNQLVKLKAKEADINKTDNIGDFFSDIMQSKGASLAGLLPGATVTSDAVDKATKKVKDFQKTAGDKSWVTDSTGGLHKVAKGFGATATEARAAAAAIRTNRKAANEVAHQFVGLGASLNDTKVSLNDWIHDMEQAATALSQFASNAVKAAKRGLRDGLIRELQAAGPAGALRMKQLADGTSAQISRANKAWIAGRRAIREYTNAVGGVPSNKTTKIIENGALPARLRIKAMRDEIQRLKNKTVHMDAAGAEIARGKIAALRDAINSLRSRTITINYHGVRTGAAVGGRTAQAYGNLYPTQHYAFGDIANRHMPELAGPGPARVWREPETQGEAYIPLANDDRRPRARAIAAETVSLLGGTAHFAQGGVQYFAKGGVDHHDGRAQLRHRFHELSKAVYDSTKAIDRERSRRDALVAKRDELKGNVADKFKTDLFGDTSNVWAAGGGDTLGVLKADIAKAKAFQHTLKGLRQQGLNGDALADIASTGDIGKAQALASLGKSGIARYEKLYDQRTRAANQVGAYAGLAAYGTQIAKQTHELRKNFHELNAMKHHLALMRKELAHHPKKTGDAVGHAVNHAAAAGHRRKS